MDKDHLDKLKVDLSLKAKNGIDFIVAASIVWVLISLIWTLSYSSYNKSVFTFMVSGILLPLAFLLSKVFRTEWKNPTNPIAPLGLWLNFAQLFYFPFLVFVLLKMPDYFIMTYAIITGAHLFPYAWFYDEMAYGVAAGVISIGALLLALQLTATNMYVLPLLVSLSLVVLASILYLSFRKKSTSASAFTE